MKDVEDLEELRRVLGNYVDVVIGVVSERNKTWGSAWDEMRSEGLEDLIHTKAHRLCNCPASEKRECLIDLLAYATKRWQRGFGEEDG